MGIFSNPEDKAVEAVMVWFCKIEHWNTSFPAGKFGSRPHIRGIFWRSGNEVSPLSAFNLCAQDIQFRFRAVYASVKGLRICCARKERGRFREKAFKEAWDWSSQSKARYMYRCALPAAIKSSLGAAFLPIETKPQPMLCSYCRFQADYLPDRQHKSYGCQRNRWWALR